MVCASKIRAQIGAEQLSHKKQKAQAPISRTTASSSPNALQKRLLGTATIVAIPPAGPLKYLSGFVHGRVRSDDMFCLGPGWENVIGGTPIAGARKTRADDAAGARGMMVASSGGRR